MLFIYSLAQHTHINDNEQMHSRIARHEHALIAAQNNSEIVLYIYSIQYESKVKQTLSLLKSERLLTLAQLHCVSKTRCLMSICTTATCML